MNDESLISMSSLFLQFLYFSNFLVLHIYIAFLALASFAFKLKEISSAFQNEYSEWDKFTYLIHYIERTAPLFIKVSINLEDLSSQTPGVISLGAQGGQAPMLKLQFILEIP